jgi:predicted  nucleic acid-binding Zn-ribbon protein
MASVPAILREAHRLRRLLRDLQAEIDRGPRVRKAQQAKLDQAEAAWRDAQDGLKKLKVTVHEKDTSLKATEQAIKKYTKQLDEVGSPKEYEAKQTEITNAKNRVATLEEEILAGLAEIDERTAGLPGEEAKVKQARTEFAAWEAQAKERLDGLTAEHKRADAELKALEATLPPDAVAQYNRLVKAYAADAFAAVQGRSCQHCFTNLTEQAATNLTNGQFVCCPGCARGLYLPA